MIKSFDFLYQAWADKAFRTQLLDYLYSSKSGRLSTDILVLSFDGVTKKVSVSPKSQTGQFAAKIIPVTVTYDGIIKMLEKRFDDLLPSDILYMMVD